ncbi:hypothetical protein D3C87_1359100 [compost metagenome]
MDYFYAIFCLLDKLRYFLKSCTIQNGIAIWREIIDIVCNRNAKVTLSECTSIIQAITKHDYLFAFVLEGFYVV